MFLTYNPDGSLVHIQRLEALLDPFVQTVEGRFHAGEEIQDPQAFLKRELCFPSGEQLPRCWLDPDYGHGGPRHRCAEDLRA
ncbi:MAG: acetyltransferase [Cyanobacteriota bacterium]|nr:acetyltransferase [Cyanobacteriota bacterium]